jgi:hypothetical protein
MDRAVSGLTRGEESHAFIKASANRKRFAGKLMRRFLITVASEERGS